MKFRTLINQLYIKSHPISNKQLSLRSPQRQGSIDPTVLNIKLKQLASTPNDSRNVECETAFFFPFFFVTPHTNREIKESLFFFFFFLLKRKKSIVVYIINWSYILGNFSLMLLIMNKFPRTVKFDIIVFLWYILGIL